MGSDAAVHVTLILSLAVDRHRRCDHEARGTRLVNDQPLEKDPSCIGVVTDVAGDLIHRLADTDESAEMDDAVDTLKCVVDHVGITDVAAQEADSVGESDLVALVYLALEAVQDYHVLPPLCQGRNEVHADEAGAAGDECPHVHTPNEGGSQLQLAARPRLPSRSMCLPYRPPTTATINWPRRSA